MQNKTPIGITLVLLHKLIKYLIIYRLLVFNEEWEEIRHRSGPNLAQGVVVKTLVESHHPADVLLANKIQSAATASSIIASDGCCHQWHGRIVEAIGIEIFIKVRIIR